MLTASANAAAWIGDAHEEERPDAVGLPTHTVFRPANLSQLPPKSVPLVVWANGSCRASNWGYISSLTVLASHGFVVVAVGAPDASPAHFPGQGRQPERLIAAIDWALKNNGRQFQNRLDKSKIALAGQSCGGVEVFQASGDPRVGSVAVVNQASNAATDLDGVHTPTMIVSGGPTDSAYVRSMDNYNAIDVPAALVDHYEAGHTGLWFGIQNGEGSTPTLAAGTELLTNWLDFTLNGQEDAGRFLVGDECTLCTAGFPWTVQSKGFE
jgi:hypothetical protein